MTFRGRQRNFKNNNKQLEDFYLKPVVSDLQSLKRQRQRKNEEKTSLMVGICSYPSSRLLQQCHQTTLPSVCNNIDKGQNNSTQFGMQFWELFGAGIFHIFTLCPFSLGIVQLTFEF